MKNVNQLVSIVIVSWNGKALLEECLETLTKIEYKNHEIIVVDNGSKDGTQEFLKEKYKSIRLIENNENLGFAEGNNVGIKASRGEAILLLNNDTKVTKDFLNILVEGLFSEPSIGIVQPKILYFSKPTIIDSVGSFLTNTGFLYHYGYYKNANEGIFNKQISIFTAKGACMLCKKEVLDKTGYFDADYFAYFEETDLCQRVWLAGYKIIYIPESTIFHKGGETSNRLNSAFVQYHSYKNRIATYIKNLSVIELAKILPVHIILCELSSIVFLLKGKFPVFIAIQRAILWNLLNLGMLLKKRKWVQNKIRKVSDNSFIYLIKKTVGFKYLYYLFTGLENMPIKYYK